MLAPRNTVRSEAVFEGAGLHSGLPVRVTVRPGRDGIHFWIPEGKIEASPKNVSDTSRCTKLGNLSTIEHLMAALAGSEITDADIEVSANELPAMDGAALSYVIGLVGCQKEQIGELEVSGLFTRIFRVEGDAKVAVGKGDGHWRYEFVNEAHWPFEQVFETTDTLGMFSAAIAPARTWGFEHEIEQIQAAGLAKGLSLENALIIRKEGYVNEGKFPDEPARHKLLDCIGDLYLSGIPISLLNVVAHRSGHALNVKTALALSESVRIERR